MGEVLAISRVIDELKTHLPDWRIVVSTTTDTGQKLAREGFGENNVFYFPVDLPFAVRAYLQALRPKLLVLAESEFWPNLLHWARLSGAAVAVVNARVSDRSLPGYLRFQKLLRRVMQNVQLFLAQSEEDARRLIQMGAPTERVHVSGNLKFDVKPTARPAIAAAFGRSEARRDRLRCWWQAAPSMAKRPCCVEMFRQVLARYPNALLLLAPRHPERFDAVASLLESSGLRYRRRSQGKEERPIAEGVFLLDSIGELASLYEFADVAFVGGSLVARGGHNVLEAAQFGTPILVGPYTENFRDIVDVFRDADALRVVTPESLTATVLQLLENQEERAALGRRGFEVMRLQRGATERTVTALLELLSEQGALSRAEITSERRA